jgi:hypothetical protein
MRPHWIETVEQEANEESGRIKRHSTSKSERIRENFISHETVFINALNAMETLINRANLITDDHRKGLSLIGFKARKTQNEDYQHFYSSSRNITPPRLLGFIPLYRGKEIKHCRRIRLSMSDKQAMIRLEFKENVRLLTPLGERRLHFSPRFKRKNSSHVIIYFPVTQLNQELFYELLDWLAFTHDILDCPFLNKHRSRMKILSR